jgi:hypothetical protein
MEDGRKDSRPSRWFTLDYQKAESDSIAAADEDEEEPKQATWRSFLLLGDWFANVTAIETDSFSRI